jgi:hypothetical protein
MRYVTLLLFIYFYVLHDWVVLLIGFIYCRWLGFEIFFSIVIHFSPHRKLYLGGVFVKDNAPQGIISKFQRHTPVDPVPVAPLFALEKLKQLTNSTLANSKNSPLGPVWQHLRSLHIPLGGDTEWLATFFKVC